jgi:hypothetical protein
MTSLLYGVAGHSLATVSDLIRPLAKKYEARVKVITSQDVELPKADIYLIPNFKTLSKHGSALKGKKSAAIIIDTPLILREIKGLRFLDCSNKVGLSYILKMRSMDNEALRDLVKSAASKKADPLEIKVEHFAVLPKLIEVTKEGKFLDKFNALIYYSTNKDNRNTVKLAILRYLFSKNSLETTQNKLAGVFARSKAGSKLVEAVFDYLKTKEGETLWKACQAIAAKRDKSKKGQVSYESICKKFKVDRHELKYLGKIYRQAKKEANFEPGTLSQIVARDLAKEAAAKPAKG